MTNIMLLNSDLDLHIDNTRELYLDLLSLRFESNIIEKKSLIYSMILCTQQIRISLYYQLHKLIKVVDTPCGSVKQKLYYMQPDT